MQYVNFGQTGLKISRLGFGGIPIQRIDQPGTRELLIAAHKAGVNYIDTARAYTVSEAWMGMPLMPREPLVMGVRFTMSTRMISANPSVAMPR